MTNGPISKVWFHPTRGASNWLWLSFFVVLMDQVTKALVVGAVKGKATFALLPILGLVIAPHAYRMHFIAGVTLISLATLGAIGGKLGGAPKLRAALRVTIGGALAMAVTAGIGHLTI